MFIFQSERKKKTLEERFEHGISCFGSWSEEGCKKCKIQKQAEGPVLQNTVFFPTQEII